jgi:hypothetical protein
VSTGVSQTGGGGGGGDASWVAAQAEIQRVQGWMNTFFNTSDGTKCSADMKAVGTTSAALQAAVNQVYFYDGTISEAPLSSLYVGAAAQAGANQPSITIAQAFAQSPGTAAMTQIGAPVDLSKIYINPAYFSSSSLTAGDIATIMHELLHAVTGDIDTVLQAALGIPLQGTTAAMGTYDITVKLMSDCVVGNGQ